MIRILIVFLALCLGQPVWAQRNINFVIPFTPGGTTDRVALLVLPYLKQELNLLGWNPVLTHIPGASGLIGSGLVAKSDRPQLLLAPNTLLTASVLNPSAASFNVQDDLVPLHYIGHVSMLLVVNKSSSWRTIEDLHRDCVRRDITYGSGGVGSLTHISSAMVMNHFKCKSTHVPYKSIGSTHSDLLGNHIDFLTDFVPSTKPHIDTDSYRPLLVVDRARNGQYPGVPSMADIGYKDYDLYNWWTMAVSARLPDEDQERLKQALAKVFQNPVLKQQLEQAGLSGLSQTLPRNFYTIEFVKMQRILQKASIDAK
jgi:tripartite-type tricarboxylate transporter receptor subunit TctC